MRIDVESFKDFCQYYTGRFVKSRTEGEILYVHGKLSDNAVNATVYVNGRHSKDITLSWAEIGDRLLFGLPRLGMMVYKHQLLFLYYAPTRHGGRGYDQNRIRVCSHNSWALMSAGVHAQDYNIMYPPFVHLALRHRHTPWDEAVTDLTSTTPRNPAYAVSFNFGVFLNQEEHPKLCYKTDVIGDVVANNKIILSKAFDSYAPVIGRWLNTTAAIEVKSP